MREGSYLARLRRPGVGRVAERVWHLRDDAAGSTSKGNVQRRQERFMG
jgi:hypothetical protein